MLIQEKNERVCENSDNKNVDDRACQNNESGVVHLQEYGAKKMVKEGLIVWIQMWLKPHP